VSPIARAETYPARPVRFIVGFTPGGSFDITARLIGQWLSERLGQQFVIENRPRAAGNIASEAAVKSCATGLPSGHAGGPALVPLAPGGSQATTIVRRRGMAARSVSVNAVQPNPRARAVVSTKYDIVPIKKRSLFLGSTSLAVGSYLTADNQMTRVT
jgi:hypothetical protein